MNPKTFIINKIDVTEVRTDAPTLQYFSSHPDSNFQDLRPGGLVDAQPFKQETIHIMEFIRPTDGTTIRIGLSSQVSKMIGITFEAFDNMRNKLEFVREMNNTLMNQQAELRDKLSEMKTAGITKRVKWLFTGVR